VILKALAKQPEQRFQSIAQMRQAILATTAPSPLALRAHPSVDPVMSAEILLPDGAPAAWRRPPEGDVSAATRTAGYDVPDSQPNIPELGNFDDAPTAYFSAHPVEATAWIRAPRRLDVDHTLVASEVATPFEVPRVVTEIVVQPLQPSVEPSVPTDWIDEDERFHQSPSLATVVTGIVFTILLAGSGIVLALTY
jgi:hypothetical protein